MNEHGPVYYLVQFAMYGLAAYTFYFIFIQAPLKYLREERAITKRGHTPLEKPVYIYLLVDKAKRPFYAGRTVSPEHRLKQHLGRARPNGTPKERAIYKLIRSGHPPEMLVINRITTSEEDAREAERRAIEQFGTTNVLLP